MMSNSVEGVLSEEQLDFLAEMMNVGIGNAAVALEQLLQCQVEVEIPKVSIFLASQISAFFDNPSLPVACVTMGMVGDVVGDLFFISPAEERDQLIHLAEEAAPGSKEAKREFAAVKEWNASVLAEVANITAGAYLLAIYEFSRLNLYHTVPTLNIDMIQAILDESLARRIAENPVIILIQNDFLLSRKHLIGFFLLLIPSMESTQKLAGAIEKARQEMFN